MLTNPFVAAGLFIGSLWVFYYTDLFRWSLYDHLGHEWMIAHFLITGYLFVLTLIGIDPVPYRLPYPGRLLLLIGIMAMHAFFGIAIMMQSGLMVAEWFGSMGRTWGATPLEDQYAGGGIAWSIGEIPTLILAITVAIQWSRSDDARSAPARSARRSDRGCRARGLQRSAWPRSPSATRARAAERELRGSASPREAAPSGVSSHFVPSRSPRTVPVSSSTAVPTVEKKRSGVKRSRHPVLPQHVLHGPLHLGEQEPDAVCREVVVELDELVDRRRVDVGDGLGREDHGVHAGPAAFTRERTQSSKVAPLAKNSGASNRTMTMPGMRDPSGLRDRSW